MGNKIREVGWSKLMEGFIGEQKNFIINVLRDGKPVEFLEDEVM